VRIDISDLSIFLVRFIELGNALVLVLAIGVALQLTGYSGTGRWLTFVAGFGFFAVVALPIDQWLAKPLEDRFLRPRWPERVDGILVLSAAQKPFISARRGIPVQHSGAGSIFAAVELLRRYPLARVVFTGGSWRGAILPAAGVAREMFDQLGADPQRISYENRSRNTWENLLFAREIAQPKRMERWLLVASALHMPRAIGVAQRLDWQVMPWPTDYLTPGGDALVHRISLGRNLATIDAALHEWVGLLVYRLADRTSALFPRPASQGGSTR